MKRIMKFAGIIAASAALMVCCSKEASYDDVATDPSTQQQGDTNPSIVSGEVLDSFGAKFENDVNTKVSITINKTNATLDFVVGDAVLVVSGLNTAKYVYNGEKFVPDPESTPLTLDTDVTVYYPFDEFAFDDSKVVFTMPDAVEDLGDLGAKNPLAAQLSGDDTDGYTATFKAVGSVLQVNVTGALAISSVKLQNAGVSRMPLGPDAHFTIGWNADDEPTMAANESASNSEMTVSRNVTLSETSETFYYIVPAGVAYTDVSVLAQFSSATIGGLSTFTVSRGDWTADRNKVYTMSFYAGLFSGGDGSDADHPYKIANARDFKNIATYCANGYGDGPEAISAADFLGAYYQQTADIDFKNVQMAPISNFDNRFGGTYDGDGHELQNVNINETGAIAAVFATLNGSGEIKNLTVSGNVTKDGATENSLAAGIVGIVYDNAKITNCTNKATISSSATYTGGIVGRLYGSGSSISQCVNNGNVTSSTSYVGGIAGYVTHGYIVDCFAKGTISGARNTGGLVGYAYAANANVGIFNSVASADVITSFGEADSGAFIGRATNAGNYYCYIGNCACINGSFTATDGAAYRVAAFIGFTNTGSGSNYDRVRVWNSYTTIQDSEFNVTTSATSNYGGFIGRMNNRNSLCDCYFVCDNKHSGVNNTNVKNLTKISVSKMNGTEDLTIAGPMGQSHTNKTGKFVEILNIGNKQGDGSTPIRAFKTYDFCDWTTTGANSEPLTYPVPETLVALGEAHYK